MGTTSCFVDALARTLRWEGGYSNDPADPGGETYCGISRRSWPSWAGWSRVDAIKAAHPDPHERNDALSNDAGLTAAVQQFYLDNFWHPLQADEWPDGTLAGAVFDAEVNMGAGEGVKLLQQALGMPKDAWDGKFGPHTLAAVQRPVAGILTRFSALRAVEYGQIAHEHPGELGYLTGWLRRALAPLLA